MDERTALDVIAARALEGGARSQGEWSDADRVWASRAAAEVVGERATPAQFLGRRAALVLERAGERDRRFVRAARSLAWRPWVGHAIVAAAFVLGIAVDRIGGSHTINLLAPPVFLLLVWNLAVYVLLAVAPLIRHSTGAPPGLLRTALVWLATSGRASRNARYAALAETWSSVAAPLYGARAARILHCAALALALGVLAGMYLRGIALEYRATWESTFFDAAQVHALLAFALALGAKITGVTIPDAAHVASIRAPASENAALWLHLIAATVLAIVIVPRAMLGAYAGYREGRCAANMPVPLAEPYFQRLLRGFRGGRTHVRVVAYSCTPGAATLAGLEAIVARAFGGGATLVVDTPVAYGDEPSATHGNAAYRIVLFNASATPERDVHGRFVAALARDERTLAPLIALVDQSALRAKSAGDEARLEARRASWREAIGGSGVAIVFVDLATPDLAAAEAALDDVFNTRAAASGAPA